MCTCIDYIVLLVYALVCIYVAMYLSGYNLIRLPSNVTYYKSYKILKIKISDDVLPSKTQVLVNTALMQVIIN